jgi:hypothetical protein
MAEFEPGSSTLPDTLGTVPSLFQGLGAQADTEARGAYARKQVPALFKGAAEAQAEAKMGAFERDQEQLRKTAEAERAVARGTEREARRLETGLEERGVFEPPQYKASDYATNSATRLLTAVLLGGIARTSAAGQLQAVQAMQDAEERGLMDQFEAARLRFDEQEKQRQDNNKMLKDRFDRMIDLLSKDRTAALVEAKLIEGNLGKGIIAAELRSGNYAKAYDLFNKAIDADDRIKLERVKAAERLALERLKGAQSIATEQAKAAAKPPKIEQLPAGLEKTLEKVGQANTSLNRANQTKKPEFFGIAPSDAIADLIVSGVEKGLPVGDVMRSIGFKGPQVTPQAVEWWKDYQSFVAQVRNQLFGATLTPREAADFRKFNVGPATAPEVAEDYFRRQIQIVSNAVERERSKGRARGVSEETLSAFLDLPEDDVVPGGGRPASFETVEEAEAAFNQGRIKKGDAIIVGGRRATYE